MQKLILITLMLIVSANARATDSKAKEVRKPSSTEITIRTEDFPRPPYSGATYFIYEQDGKQICTKLKVCNKFDDCEITYYKGAFKDSEDIETGNPFNSTPAQPITSSSVHKHLCLTKFHIAR